MQGEHTAEDAAVRTMYVSFMVLEHKMSMSEVRGD